MDYLPQSWEAVLSFIASQHLQWGQDVIFTYGPLGFLANDYYSGEFFWPVLLWAFGFSIILTILLMRFWPRVRLPVRVALCIALPLLTIPRSADLGYDSLYLFAITLAGMTCLPGEKASTPYLAVSGALLGVLGLFKFTFCLYAILTLLAVVAANASVFDLRRLIVVAGSAIISFFAAWLITCQNVSNILAWFQNSLLVVSGYSSAMSIPASLRMLIFGTAIVISILIFLVVLWSDTRETSTSLFRAAIIAAGIFLAWKEGIDRSDSVHTRAFLVYAGLVAATMPAFFQADATRRRFFLPLMVVAIVFVFATIAAMGCGFGSAIATGFGVKLRDTFTAVFTPLHYKRRLEAHLISRRDAAALPQMSTVVGDSPLTVLGYQIDLAVLNQFNYRLQPVFQDYSAYTPQLQQLNAQFFASTNAPQFVVWDYSTIISRFPALDGGSIILTMLNNYTPVIPEKECVLWKRNDGPGQTFQFTDPKEISANLNQWVAVPTNATWLTVQMQRTWAGHLKEFFYQATLPVIEVLLADGRSFSYDLVTGQAESGFVINPLIATERDLYLPALGVGEPLRVNAVRITAASSSFKDAICYRFERITGVPRLDRELISANVVSFSVKN